jgi:hypothetical protein
MSDSFQFSALPDDMLRAMATFVPLSGMIVLVRSNRTLATVLKHQLTKRLDNLFFLTQSEILLINAFYVEPLAQPCQHELEVLFGEARLNAWGWSTCCFVEDPMRYTEPFRSILTRFPPGYRCYKAASSRNDSAICFVTWLQRRLERLLHRT